MALAVEDQIKTAGSACTVVAGAPRSYTLPCKAVLTSRDGSMDADVGGAVYAVTGHALIKKDSISQAPKPGDRISVDGESNKWLILNAISSPNDAGISCDLTLISE